MTLHVRPAGPDDVPRAVALLDAVWPWQANVAMLTADPGYQTHQTRVAVLGGRVVAMAQVVRRTMWVGDRAITVGLVGNVATAPEHRRKGFAHAVLQDAIGYMETAGFDLSLLHAAAFRLYATLGWQAVPERITSFHLLPSARSGGNPGYTARQACWEKDLPAVAAVYDVFSRGKTGAIVRPFSYWRACRQWLQQEDDSRFLVVEHGGEIVAYVRGDRERNTILELGFVRAAALPELFAAIAGHFDNARFIAHLPPDPVLDAYLDRHTTDLRHDSDAIPGVEPTMFRPILAPGIAGLEGFYFSGADRF